MLTAPKAIATTPSGWTRRQGKRGGQRHRQRERERSPHQVGPGRRPRPTAITTTTATRAQSLAAGPDGSGARGSCPQRADCVDHLGISVRNLDRRRISRKDDPAHRPIGRCRNGRTPDAPDRPRSPTMAPMTASTVAAPPGTPRPDPIGRSRPHLADTLLGRVGGWCFDHRRARDRPVARRPRRWSFAAAGTVGPSFGSGSAVPGSDSAAGFAVLEEHFPELGTGGQSGTIVFRADQGVDDPEVRRRHGGAVRHRRRRLPRRRRSAAGARARPSSRPTPTEGRGQIATTGPLAGELASPR